MDVLKRLAAIYLLAVALVAFAQIVLSPFYDNVLDVLQIWHTLNWFMAISIIITLIMRFHDKMTVDRDENGGVSRQYLEAYAGLIATVFLSLLFFWNWGDEFITSGGEASLINLLVWTFLNPFFVLVTGLAGCRLWSSR